MDGTTDAGSRDLVVEDRRQCMKIASGLLDHGELRERVDREVCTHRPPNAHVARDLGIRKEALLQWVRQADAGPG
ncbi:hypothetical protein [Streptomyces sp. NPDC048825]|uniref:hypothetical protein n=1 Tax=Streptomyces sp. NPDC048825 TaxID=3365592 RepID=UPI0037128EDC